MGLLDPQTGRILTYFFCIFAIRMRWEYLHWTDLGLTKLMEVSTFQIYLIKMHFLQHLTLLRLKKTAENVQKGPMAAKRIFVGPHRASWGPYRALLGLKSALIGPHEAFIGTSKALSIPSVFLSF